MVKLGLEAFHVWKVILRGCEQSWSRVGEINQNGFLAKAAKHAKDFLAAFASNASSNEFTIQDTGMACDAPSEGGPPGPAASRLAGLLVPFAEPRLAPRRGSPSRLPGAAFRTTQLQTSNSTPEREQRSKALVAQPDSQPGNHAG